MCCCFPATIALECALNLFYIMKTSDVALIVTAYLSPHSPILMTKQHVCSDRLLDL